VLELTRQETIDCQQLQIECAAKSEKQFVIIRSLYCDGLKRFAQLILLTASLNIRPFRTYRTKGIRIVVKFARKLNESQPLRFLLAGVVNTLWGFATYSLCIIAGATVWVSLLAGILSGMAFNFLTTGGYVFRDLTLKRLPKFIAFYLLVFTVNLQSINFLSTWVSNSIQAQAIITPPLAVFSYLLLGRFVFAPAGTPADVEPDQ